MYVYVFAGADSVDEIGDASFCRGLMAVPKGSPVWLPRVDITVITLRVYNPNCLPMGMADKKRCAPCVCLCVFFIWRCVCTVHPILVPLHIVLLSVYRDSPFWFSTCGVHYSDSRSQRDMNPKNKEMLFGARAFWMDFCTELTFVISEYSLSRGLVGGIPYDGMFAPSSKYNGVQLYTGTRLHNELRITNVRL